MWYQENPANDVGEGAPWTSAELAPLVANVLTGLPSTPRPPLTAEGLSDEGGDGVKAIAGVYSFGPLALKF